jgi:hypothetical protein
VQFPSLLGALSVLASPACLNGLSIWLLLVVEAQETLVVVLAVTARRLWVNLLAAIRLLKADWFFWKILTTR